MAWNTSVPSRGGADPQGIASDRRRFITVALAAILTAIQQSLYDVAKAARDAATVKIDNLREFEAYFTPQNEERPELHGGLAYSHFVDSPEMDAKLKALKATIRCLPLDAPDEPGKCIFTGRPSTKRGVFAKAY